MNVQTVFQRYEIKYMLTSRQKAELLLLMEQYMIPDAYGRSTIRNIYYDTPNYSLARRSVEKPVYKEKLRIRSYNKATTDSKVFVELKKKYLNVVYKRRVALPEGEVCEWFRTGELPSFRSQITDEIEYFRKFCGTLRPAAYISYDREAYYSQTDHNFRMTFDENLLARTTELSLCRDPGGNDLLPPDHSLLEIKTAGGIPLWLTSFLTANKIYKCSFSKYGTAYTDYIFEQKGEKRYVG